MNTIKYSSRWFNSGKVGMDPKGSAITLVELMVVVVIIGIIAEIGLPSLKGIGQSNFANSAYQQVVDDLSLARQRAIKDRTTVYMVFVPPQISQAGTFFGRLNAKQRMVYTNLLSGQFTSYALLSTRSVGDQPGRSIPRYLSEWKTLPEGMLIRPGKFTRLSSSNAWYNWIASGNNPTNRLFISQYVPFPTEDAPFLSLPVIAFDYQGQLVTQQDEFLQLAHGNVFYSRNEAGDPLFEPADVVINPPGNFTNRTIQIHWVTGKSRIIKPELK